MTYLIFNEDGRFQGKSEMEHRSPDNRTTVEISEPELSALLRGAEVEYLPEIGITPEIAAKEPLEYVEFLKYEDGEVVFDYDYTREIWPAVDFSDVKFWYDEEYDCPVMYSVEPEFVHILTVSVVSYPERYSPEWAKENPEGIVQSILNDILEHEGKELTVGCSMPDLIGLIIGDEVKHMDEDPEVTEIWNNSDISSDFETYGFGEVGRGHAYMWKYDR